MTLRWISLRLTFFLVISTLLSGCVFSYPPRRPDGFLRLGIEDPLPYQVLGLTENAIYGYADSTGLDVEQLIFYANGREIGAIVGPGESLDPRGSEGEMIWLPPVPGEYLLQVEGVVADGPEGMSHPVRVCVVDFDVEAAAGGLVWYEGPCDFPVRTVALSAPGAVTMEARATPDTLQYRGVRDGEWCADVRDPSILFSATVIDPRDEVVAVLVLYSMTYSPGSPFAGETSTHRELLTLTGSGLEPRSKSFSGRSIELDVPGYITLGDSLRSTQALEVIWSAQALGRRGETIVEAGPFSIPAFSSCGPAEAPLLLVPTATTTLEPSEANCPPGTYYAPATNQCIAIEIPSPKPDGKTCSEYGTQSSCESAGCTWDGQSQSCK